MKTEKQYKSGLSRIIKPKQKQKISIVDNRSLQRSSYLIHKTLPLVTTTKIVDKNQLGRYLKINPNLIYKQITSKNPKFEVQTSTLPNTEGKERIGRTAREVNKITKNEPHYTGGHLIKAEWGGDDNIINVASWLDASENLWSSFENIVAQVSQTDPTKRVWIDVKAEKDDEMITHSDIQPQIMTKFPQSIDLALRSLEYRRWTVNKAAETIPRFVRGQILSPIKHSIELNAPETGWDVFKNKGISYLIEIMRKPNFLDSKKPNLNEQQITEARKRSNERKKALATEYDTLKGIDPNAEFEQDIEPDWDPRTSTVK